MVHTTGCVIKGCVSYRSISCSLGAQTEKTDMLHPVNTLFTGGIFFIFSADLLPKSVESVFIFQEASEGEPDVAAPTYDAIVVEQWTIIDVSGEILVTVSQLSCSLSHMGQKHMLHHFLK